MIKHLLLVALGGGVGSALRYFISLFVSKHYPDSFPIGTFAVNITGCLVIGFLVGLSVRYNLLGNELRLLLIAGFCGGYTTFSTFSLENMRLFETGQYLTMALYVVGSILLGLIAVWGGDALSKLIVR